MKFKHFNAREIIISAYTTLFVLSPILSNRITDIFGLKVLVGAITMTFVFGLLDVINNTYGEDQAKQTVITATAVRMISWLLISFAVATLPAWKETPGFSTLVVESLRIFVSGEASFLLSQYFVDIPVFNFFKKRFNSFWIRYNLSNMVSNTLQTALFVFFGFVGKGVPLLNLMAGQLLFRVCISFATTPIFGLLVTLLKKADKSKSSGSKRQIN